MTESSLDKAIGLIKNSASQASSLGENWSDSPSLVNPETVLFLIEQIERQQSLIKSLLSEESDYMMGYEHGFEDRQLSDMECQRPVFAWAITDTERRWVKFSIEKPSDLPKEQKAHALFC